MFIVLVDLLIIAAAILAYRAGATRVSGLIVVIAGLWGAFALIHFIHFHH